MAELRSPIRQWFPQLCTTLVLMALAFTAGQDSAEVGANNAHLRGLSGKGLIKRPRTAALRAVAPARIMIATMVLLAVADGAFPEQPLLPGLAPGPPPPPPPLARTQTSTPRSINSEDLSEDLVKVRPPVSRGGELDPDPSSGTECVIAPFSGVVQPPNSNSNACDPSRPLFVVLSTQRSGTHFLAQSLMVTGTIYHGGEKLYKAHPNNTRSCCKGITDYLRSICREAREKLPGALAVGGVVMMSDIRRFAPEVLAALGQAGIRMVLLHRRNSLRQVVSELHHMNNHVFGARTAGELAKARALKVQTSPRELFAKTMMTSKAKTTMTALAVVDYKCNPRELPVARPCGPEAGSDDPVQEAACHARASTMAARGAVIGSVRLGGLVKAWPSRYLCATTYYEDLLDGMAAIPTTSKLRCSGFRSAADPGCPLETLVMFLSSPAALRDFVRHRDEADVNIELLQETVPGNLKPSLKKVHVGSIWSFVEVDEAATRRVFNGTPVEWMLDD